MITFIGLLANCNEWTEIQEFAVIHQEWFKKFLDLKYEIHSLSTIEEIINIIDPKELEEVCVNITIRTTP